MLPASPLLNSDLYMPILTPEIFSNIIIPPFKGKVIIVFILPSFL